MDKVIAFIHFIFGQLLVTPIWWAVGMIIGGTILVLCIWLSKDRMDALIKYHRIVDDIQNKEKKLKDLNFSIYGLENREKEVAEKQKNIEQEKKHLKNQRVRFNTRNHELNSAIDEYNSMYSDATQFSEINKRTENEIKARISSKDHFAITLKPYIKTVGRANNYLQNQEVKLALKEEFSSSPILDFVEKIYSLLVGKGVPGVVAAWLLYRSLSGLN